jgi:hypothetical protein
MSTMVDGTEVAAPVDAAPPAEVHEPLTASPLGATGELVADRYRLGESLGRGGMGRVFRAHDELLGRDVAVKLIYDEALKDEELSRECAAEARVAARLAHAGIARVLDSGVDDGRCFVVSELVEGQTLSAILAEEAPLPVGRAIDLAIQIAGALAAIQEHGIVHCDVKPSNVIVGEDGQIKLVDFGIARVTATTGLTGLTGEPLRGSAEYVAPEQVQGDRTDSRVDIYALGIVLYEMLAGRTPFAGGTLASVVARRLVMDPPPLTEKAPAVTESLERVVERALERDPSLRFQTADEFRDALIAVRDGHPVVLPANEPSDDVGEPARAGSYWSAVAPAAGVGQQTTRTLDSVARRLEWAALGLTNSGFGRRLGLTVPIVGILVLALGLLAVATVAGMTRMAAARTPVAVEVEPPPTGPFTATGGAAAAPAVQPTTEPAPVAAPPPPPVPTATAIGLSIPDAPTAQPAPTEQTPEQRAAEDAAITSASQPQPTAVPVRRAAPAVAAPAPAEPKPAPSEEPAAAPTSPPAPPAPPTARPVPASVQGGPARPERTWPMPNQPSSQAAPAPAQQQPQPAAKPSQPQPQPKTQSAPAPSEKPSAKPQNQSSNGQGNGNGNNKNKR